MARTLTEQKLKKKYRRNRLLPFNNKHFPVSWRNDEDIAQEGIQIENVNNALSTKTSKS